LPRGVNAIAWIVATSAPAATRMRGVLVDNEAVRKY
jgi:hypothetical protein